MLIKLVNIMWHSFFCFGFRTHGCQWGACCAQLNDMHWGFPYCDFGCTPRSAILLSSAHLNFNPPGCHFKVLWMCKRLYWQYTSVDESVPTQASYKRLQRILLQPHVLPIMPLRRKQKHPLIYNIEHSDSNKCGESGLNLAHLSKIHDRDRENGFRNFFCV